MRRSIAIAVVIGACVLGSAAATTPAAAATTQDLQMKKAILLLRGYIDRIGALRSWVFPVPSGVQQWGTLEAPLWPRDPWTGASLSAGTIRGHYVYWVSGDQRRYRLTGYLSSGTYVVSGGMPPMTRLAYVHRAMEGLSLVQQYIELWTRNNGGVYPVGAQVRRHGAVGEQPGMAFWPSNPYDHDAMTEGTRCGFFHYVRADDGSGYTLSMKLGLGRTMRLTNAPFRPTASPSPSESAAAGGPTTGLLADLVGTLR